MKYVKKTIGTAVGPCRKSILMSEIHTAVMCIPVDLQVFHGFSNVFRDTFARLCLQFIGVDLRHL
jgi:hypothetical protein